MDGDPHPVVVPPRPVRRSLTRGGGLVTPAVTALNLVGYALAVAAARLLNQSSFGELNALLGGLLIASVPSLALQAVVARSIARRPAGEVTGPRERALLLRATVAGAVVGCAVGALAPLVAAFLHVPVAGPLWLAAGIVPLATLAAAMGLLQGAERFGALAAAIGAQTVAKAAGLLPLLAHGDPADVLAALAAGTALAAVFAAALARPGGARAGAPHDLPRVPDLLVAAGSVLALLVLTNLDVLLARHVLNGDGSGRYSAGAVFAKVALWLPQAVVVVAFPRLSEPEAGRALLRRSLLLLAALSLVEVAGAALLARPVLELTFGRSYGAVASLVPVFVLQGGTLAMVQLMVYRGIATLDQVPGRVVLAATALEALLVLALHPVSAGPVIGVAAGVAVVLAAALLTRALRRGAAPPTGAPPELT